MCMFMCVCVGGHLWDNTHLCYYMVTNTHTHYPLSLCHTHTHTHTHYPLLLCHTHTHTHTHTHYPFSLSHTHTHTLFIITVSHTYTHTHTLDREGSSTPTHVSVMGR